MALVLAMAAVCLAGPSLHQMLEGKEAGSIWALIVAGSNTWMNYRHQVRERTPPHAADRVLQLSEYSHSHLFEVASFPGSRGRGLGGYILRLWRCGDVQRCIVH